MMNIRKFELHDEQRVKDLILSILGSEYPFDRKAYSSSDLNSLSDTYAGPRDIFLILENDEEVIGTIAVKEESTDSALIRRFFVHNVYRGKGYGKQLMEEAIRYCNTKHYKHVVFQGTGRMVQALELCKKRGFNEGETVELGGFHIYKFVLDL